MSKVWTVLIVLCMGLLPLNVTAADAVDVYLKGLSALHAARYAEAEGHFVRAIAGADETADFHLALAVSRILQEKPDVDAALTRAQKLAPRFDQIKLWRYAANQMFKPAGSHSTNPPYEVRVPYTRALIETMSLFGTLERPNRRDEARRNYPALAVAFVEQQMVRPAVWPRLLQRATVLFRNRKFAEACPLVDGIRAGRPQDSNFLYLSGSCYLFRKNYSAARKDYTELLIQRPNHAYALLGRARAAALMGDADRARRDYATAEKIAPKKAKAYAKSVFSVLRKHQADAKPVAPQKLLAAVKAAIAKGAALQDTIAQAVPLVRARLAANWNRDEVYADRVGELKRAIAARPGDPDPLVALGAFYLRPLGPRDIRTPDGRLHRAMLPLRDPWREFGGKTVLAAPWVFRGDPVAAKPYLDKALKLNSNHLGAIRQTAMRFRMHQNLDAMQPYVRRALAADPLDLDMARLYLDFHTTAAANLNRQAAALREPRVSYENRVDGRYRITTYPSAADKARAAQLDAQAQANRRQAVQPLQRLGGALKGNRAQKQKYDLANAIYYYWIGKLETAAGAVNSALKIDPTYLDALDFMIDLTTGTHTAALRDKWQGLLDGWVGTSARIQLRPVFQLIKQTKYRSAWQQLDKAEAVDPGASLIPAYRAVAAAGLKDRAAVVRAALLTMTLEGAKAKVAGRSLLPADQGPISAGDAGLTLLARLQAGQALVPSAPGHTVTLGREALTIAGRVPGKQWDDEIKTTDMPGTRKGGFSIRGLVIAHHNQLAKALDLTGDGAGAQRHRQQAVDQRQRQTQAVNQQKYEAFTGRGALK